MVDYHEGQKVEVRFAMMPRSRGKANWLWRKAKFIRMATIADGRDGYYMVQFTDGTRGVFDANNIKPVT